LDDQCVIRKALEDQKIIKFFHGCENDLKWLAYNFGYHINGLYDTSKAENLLTQNKNSQGLYILALKYLNVKLDKSNLFKSVMIRVLNIGLEDKATVRIDARVRHQGFANTLPDCC
jgi:ribonuclease D